jgi:O-antigen/teichoic acid export membrane protein
MSDTETMIDRRAVSVGASWSFFSLCARQGISLIVFFVTARYVSKESFGIMALSLAVVELLKRVAIEPFAIAASAKQDTTDDDFNASFLISAALSVLLSVILFLTAPLVAAMMGNAAIAQGLQLVSALLVSIALARTHEAWMVRRMQIRALSIRMMIAAALGGLVGVLMAINGYELWSLVGQQLVTSFVSLGLLWASCEWRPRFTTTRASLVSILSEARHISATGLGGFFTGELDIFVASSFLGVRAAGLYNAGKRIMLAINMVLSSSIQSVTFSTFANLSTSERRASIFLRAVGTISAITVPASFGIACLSHDAVLALLGPTWIEAAPILQMLTIGALLTSLNQLNTTIFMTSRQSRLSARLAWSNALLNMLLMPLFAHYGAVALAATTSAVQLLLFPISAQAASRLVGIPKSHYLRALAGPVGAASVMAMALVLVRPWTGLSGMLALIVLVPLGAVIYFTLLYIVQRRFVVELIGMGRAILRRRSPIAS